MFLDTTSSVFADRRRAELHNLSSGVERGALGVAAVAHRVGYDSEEASSRAFKREIGLAPSSWRLTR
jgi:AraC-like DNA-binding protein